MKIISAKYILTFDEKNPILTDSAIVYDKKIIEIGKKEEIFKKYQNLKIENFEENFCLMPGLINTHIHLEYSANKTSLEYGEFIRWLKSVIKQRDMLIEKLTKEKFEKKIKELLKSGTTTIGEISSFGHDISYLKNSPLNVILFNEVLGSNPAAVDLLYQDFLQRYQTSLSLEDEKFKAAISVHSPYSTHPILAKKVLSLAKEDNKIVATHFMESKAERNWLDKKEGKFKELLSQFTPNPKPMTTSMEFLTLFDQVKTLFVHATFANKEEIDYINSKNHFIISCPVSNRLLENHKIDILKPKNLAIATDGLSSNISLNLWDELRASVFIFDDIELDFLAKKLLYSVTKEAAKALNLKKGIIKKDYDSDFIVIKLADEFENINSIYKWLILHTKYAQKTIILGQEV